jgi:hypothetical protein
MIIYLFDFSFCICLTFLRSVRVNSDAVESDSTSILSNGQENGDGPQHQARETLLSPTTVPEELTPQHPHPTRPYTHPITPINENSISNPDRKSPVALDDSQENRTPTQTPMTSPTAVKLPRRRGSATSNLSINSPRDGGRGCIKIGTSQPAGSVVTTGSSDEGQHYRRPGR